MFRPPLVLGLTLCEDVVVDPATQNVSIIRAFTGLGLENLPGTARPFFAFATLTAGQGEARFRLDVHRDLGGLDTELVHRAEGNLRFQDPLQTIQWVVKLSHCSFPAAGGYLFTLWIDGAWMAQRRLRVYAREEKT
jgi:hypothetical protein